MKTAGCVRDFRLLGNRPTRPAHREVGEVTGGVNGPGAPYSARTVTLPSANSFVSR